MPLGISIVKWTILFVFCSITGGTYDINNGPQFKTEPPYNVEFSNNTGSKVLCLAIGNPDPTLYWILPDGNRVTSIRGLRQVGLDGSLIFPPFPAESYRQDVHSMIYRCVARNTVGSIVSRDVNVKAIMSQTYEAHVYDAFPLKGNTAVLKCHLPPFIGSHVTVTAWIKDDAVKIDSSVAKNNKYVLFFDELFILEVELADAASSFRCQTINTLTKETKLSSTAGKLFVSEPKSNVSPRIIDGITAISAIQGTDLTLSCIAQGFPVPKVQWFTKLSKGKLEPVILRDRMENTRVGIKIKDVQTEDGGIYVCEAKNSVGSESKEINVTITVPLSVQVEPKVIKLDANKITTLRCTVKGNPVNSVFWLKNGQPTSFNNLSETIQIRESGMYQCFAKNDDTMINDIAQVIAGDQLPDITSSFEEQVKQPGENLELTCAAIGNPLPNVTWFIDDEIVDQNRRIIITNQNENINKVSSVLKISNLKTDDGGVYSCHFINAKGAAKFSNRINVVGPPGIRPMKKILGIAGRSVQVNCPFYGYPISQVKWMKEFQSLPTDPRQFLHDNGSLWINELLRNVDDGTYTCIVKNGGKEVEQDVEIVVMIPPKIMPFSFQEDLLREGMRARLQCVVSEGDTPMHIQWLKDGAILTTNIGITVRNLDEFSSILTIANVNPKHNGNYTCQATNAAAVSTYTTKLNVNVPPKIVPFTFQDEHLLEGMLVRVSCVVSRGDLPLTITWLKDGQPIPKDLSITVRDFDEYSNVLSIDPVTTIHNGNYTCIATNAAATVTYSSLLSINVPPKWILAPNDTSVVIGSKLTLPCVTEGFPQPVVTWTKSEGRTKERHLITNNHKQLVTENGTLILFTAEEKDNGFYFCEAKNGIGRLGASIQVTIKTPPQILTKLQNITAHKDSDVKLSCETAGDMPVQFTWKSLNKTINLFTSKYVIKNSTSNNVATSELIILKTSQKDSNTYQCVANNKYGNDEGIIHLIIKDVPMTPKDLKVLETTNRSLVIAWAPQENIGMSVTRYIIQYKKIKDTWKDNTTNRTVQGKVNRIKITGLQPSVKYNIRALAENEVGFSQPSNVIEALVAEEAPSATPTDVSVIAIDTNTLKVSWKPPLKDFWNGIIRGYYVGYKVVSSSEDFVFRLIEVPEDYIETLSLSLNDLLKYTQYSIVVQAFNDGGKGPISKEVIAVTSESVPTKPPKDIRCSVLSAQSVHLTWQSPPSVAIHGVLQGYKVIFKPVNRFSTINNIHSGAKSTGLTKLTLNNLLKYTNYSFQILAFTKKGDGIKSEPIYCRTLEDIPGPIADIKVLPASQKSILVAWKAPEKPNGAIIKYTIYVKDEETEITNQYTVNGNITYYEITSLKQGGIYDVYLTASTIVGEGAQSRAISQSPGLKKIPARVAVFNSVIVTTKDKDVKLPCPAIGIPEPQKKWTRNVTPYEMGSRMLLLSDGALLIKDVARHDSDNYTCHVENELGDDLVTYSVIVQTPPDPVVIDIALITTTSIDILWKTRNDGGAPITGFKLFYKHEHIPWKIINLDPNTESFRLANLNCGTKYQLYIVAINEIGDGKATSTVTTNTKGGVPLNPPKQNLIDEGPTFVTLHLNSWQTDSCPIKYFVVEYKAKNDNQWKLFSDDIENDQRQVLLSDLIPGMWYNVRMIAHSGAGTTVAEYSFATLTQDGATISPNTIIEALPNNPITLLLDIKFIVIFLTIILSLLTIVLIFLCYCSNTNKKSHRRRRSSASRPKHGTLRSETYTDGSLTYNGSTLSDGRSGTVDSDELTPYATARLSDFIDGKQANRQSAHSSEMLNLRTQMPIAPLMSDAHSSNSLPFYSQVHKKGHPVPLTPSRSILKTTALSIPSVPLTQPLELNNHSHFKSGDFIPGENFPPPLPPPLAMENKTEQPKKYDAPWDSNRFLNN